MDYYTRTQKEVIWNHYIEYLRVWIKDCNSWVFYGDSPCTFDEFLEDLESGGEDFEEFLKEEEKLLSKNFEKSVDKK